MANKKAPDALKTLYIINHFFATQKTLIPFSRELDN